MKNYRRIIQVAFLCGLIVYTGWTIFNYQYNKKIFRNILNISDLPNSLEAIECKSPLVPTDALTTCYAEVSPSDFDNLTKGYDFSEKIIEQTSHNYYVSIRVGKEFPVTSEFKTEPQKFEHGGHVILLTNIERNKVILDLYEE